MMVAADSRAAASAEAIAEPAGERAYRLIRADILRGVLRPGQRLKLDGVRDTYGVSISTLRETFSPKADAIRDGRERELPAEQLVPGDLVVLREGDRVPADLRLVSVRGLQVDESALTGESVPVGATVDPVAADVPLGDRTSMAFAGTAVTRGHGTGVVTATGDRTELGPAGRRVVLALLLAGTAWAFLCVPGLSPLEDLGARLTSVVAGWSTTLLFALLGTVRRRRREEVDRLVEHARLLEEGRESARFWTTDLTAEYVRLNADYHT